MSKKKEPLKLKGERVWRTYIGGREIDRLHGEKELKDTHYPEEWMYSVTQAANSGRESVVEGLCKIDDGTNVSLKELIEEYPEEILGKVHVNTFGSTPGVLIKIIDSKERLTIQVHPDKSGAMRLFGSSFGKTECWHILGLRGDSPESPCIYLGFKKGITKEHWMDCFEKQDYEKMLNLLNRIEVKTGETYLVKGGVPHAIGAGCLIMEIQEPTDYTVRVEKVTPSGYVIDDRMCHQGLGFEKMFECFHYIGSTATEIKEQYRIGPLELEWEHGRKSQLIGYKDTNCFQIQKLEVEDFCSLRGEGVFYCLYILSGEGVLNTASETYDIAKNGQFFIPADSGEYCIRNAGKEALVMLKMYGPQCD